jgi:hypothetical protein
VFTNGGLAASSPVLANIGWPAYQRLRDLQRDTDALKDAF